MKNLMIKFPIKRTAPIRLFQKKDSILDAFFSLPFFFQNMNIKAFT